jgi:hypothetical protein
LIFEEIGTMKVGPSSGDHRKIGIMEKGHLLWSYFMVQHCVNRLLVRNCDRIADSRLKVSWVEMWEGVDKWSERGKRRGLCEVGKGKIVKEAA